MNTELADLFEAIAAGEDAAARRLLKGSPELAQAPVAKGGERFLAAVLHQSYAGDTALHVAAAGYRTSLVRTLIGMGADPSAKNRRGAEPLHCAAVGDTRSSFWNPRAQTATITCLIEAGADPNATDTLGVTPLHKAVRARCAAAVKALLAAGADPARTNRNGSSAMLLARHQTGRGGSGLPAAKAQQAEIVSLLDGLGAKP